MSKHTSIQDHHPSALSSVVLSVSQQVHWMSTKSINLYTSEFIQLLLSAVISSINTSKPSVFTFMKTSCDCRPSQRYFYLLQRILYLTFVSSLPNGNSNEINPRPFICFIFFLKWWPPFQAPSPPERWHSRYCTICQFQQPGIGPPRPPPLPATQSTMHRIAMSPASHWPTGGQTYVTLSDWARPGRLHIGLATGPFSLYRRFSPPNFELQLFLPN